MRPRTAARRSPARSGARAWPRAPTSPREITRGRPRGLRRERAEQSRRRGGLLDPAADVAERGLDVSGPEPGHVDARLQDEERVVEVVGHAARESPEDLELARLVEGGFGATELLVDPPPLRLLTLERLERAPLLEEEVFGPHQDVRDAHDDERRQEDERERDPGEGPRARRVVGDVEIGRERARGSKVHHHEDRRRGKQGRADSPTGGRGGGWTSRCSRTSRRGCSATTRPAPGSPR